MQYRHGIGHAPAKLALFEARNCNHWRDKLRCIIGLYLGHAPANLAFVAVLTSSFALLAFSKYWRAQIAPLTDLLYISRFILLVSTVLRFASLLVPAGSDCPLPCLYCISRYNSLIVTVLLFAGFQQVTGSDCPLTDLLYISRFILLASTVLCFASLASTSGLRLPPP